MPSHWPGGYVENQSEQRRPLKSRGAGWASLLTRLLLKTPITPNQVSILGVLFAAMGAWGLWHAPQNPWLWLIGALGIQLRLLSNMMDGLVAVEGQRGSATGPLYNELPDRLEDSILLVAAGYAAGFAWLGWLCAVLAVTTAYVRATGAYLGFGQDYCGPMAKPHRMAALTLGALGSLGLALAGNAFPFMYWMLILIAIGTAFTVGRRTLRISAQLQSAQS
jgi:phosphatidylglycerophosphate synthase